MKRQRETKREKLKEIKQNTRLLEAINRVDKQDTFCLSEFTYKESIRF